MSKHICFFTYNIGLSGGTERVCSIIANELDNAGLNISIISMFEDISHFDLNSSIDVFKIFEANDKNKFKAPIIVSRLRKILNNLKCDTIIAVDSALFCYTLPATLGLQIKNIVWEHFNYKSNRVLPRRVGRYLAKHFAECIIVLTKKDKDFWHVNETKNKIVVINNPAVLGKHIVQNNNSNKMVISLGRLTYQKGFDRLLEAWSMLPETTKLEWKLLISGSGELFSDLKTLISDLSIDNSVILRRHTENVDELYRNASLYAMTSRFEGFPMVLLEAKAYGLPIISFDCATGPSELINHKNDGILVDQDDIFSFSRQLLMLMNNSEIRNNMSKNSIENVQKFAISNILPEWLRLLN